MEKLLHYTWKHKILPLYELNTTDGRSIEVISPGTYNRSNAGPDFFNAKIKVEGMLWVGNVELHTKASDWFRHHHDSDPAYDNTILHVVTVADMDVTTSQGKTIPTLVIPIAKELQKDYEELLGSDKYPPCHRMIPTIASTKSLMWMAALQTERLEQKTIAIEERVRNTGMSWEDGYFHTLARNFGFGINSDAFEIWSRTMKLSDVAHHRDDLFQVETLFLGVAGLLENPPKALVTYLEKEEKKNIELYQKEFLYLQKKFNITPMESGIWAYLRTRPQNFPHVRLMQLAEMYHQRRTGLGQLLECETVEDIAKLYGIKGNKLNLLIINTVVPAIFAYGRHHAKEHLCERAFDLLENIKAEDNSIVRMWQECGLKVKTAGDSQALIQLKKEYCDKKDCLRCRFGYEFLSGEYRNNFFKENTDVNL